MSLAGVWALDHAKANKPLFSMTNLVGPTAQSLLAGDGLTVCTEDMGTRGNPICFHAARMPMSAMVVALGMRLLRRPLSSRGLLQDASAAAAG